MNISIKNFNEKYVLIENELTYNPFFTYDKVENGILYNVVISKSAEQVKEDWNKLLINNMNSR